MEIASFLGEKKYIEIEIYVKTVIFSLYAVQIVVVPSSTQYFFKVQIDFSFNFHIKRQG